jgi:hypothetical protein
VPINATALHNGKKLLGAKKRRDKVGEKNKTRRRMAAVDGGVRERERRENR